MTEAQPQIVRTLPVQFGRLPPAFHQFRKVRTASAQLALVPDKLFGSLAYSHFELLVDLVLCTRKEHSVVECALANLPNRLFVSKYQLEMPSREQIQQFLDAQLKEVGDP